MTSEYSAMKDNETTGMQLNFSDSVCALPMQAMHSNTQSTVKQYARAIVGYGYAWGLPQ
jgi:hypothetical protein